MPISLATPQYPLSDYKHVEDVLSGFTDSQAVSKNS
jgi:hypothetical protein